ncbi:hypothetical protein R3P38DRAFT_3177532 [Favolaschia claudopus]|uniref:ABC1 atypical kinase-like domain-containing protein n=1 Tax=Favolaschia claudopus TaxID=2862362 RepID=A0AAW0D5Z5_9AGAR
MLFTSLQLTLSIAATLTGLNVAKAAAVDCCELQNQVPISSGNDQHWHPIHIQKEWKEGDTFTIGKHTRTLGKMLSEGFRGTAAVYDVVERVWPDCPTPEVVAKIFKEKPKNPEKALAQAEYRNLEALSANELHYGKVCAYNPGDDASTPDPIIVMTKQDGVPFEKAPAYKTVKKNMQKCKNVVSSTRFKIAREMIRLAQVTHFLHADPIPDNVLMDAAGNIHLVDWGSVQYENAPDRGKITYTTDVNTLVEELGDGYFKDDKRSTALRAVSHFWHEHEDESVK